MTSVDSDPFAQIRSVWQGCRSIARKACRQLPLSWGLLTAWPSLDQIIVHARDNAPAVVDASGAVASARASGVGARVSSLGNPYVEVIADHGAPTHDVQALGTLFWPLEIQGQRRVRIDESDRLVEWKQLGRAEIQSRAMAEAVLAYGEGLVASAHVANAAAQEAEARSEASWFASKAAARDSTVVDVSLSAAEVSRYVQARAEAQLRLNDAHLRLEVLTSLSDLDATPPAGLSHDPPALRMSIENAARMVEDGQTPALRANQAESGFWTAARERASKDKHQPMSLILYGGRGDYGEARYGGGVAYTFPMTRRNQGEVARADAERSRAMQVRAVLRRVALARLRNAYSSLDTSLRAVQEMDSNGIPAAEQAVKATLDSFREGKMELVRVIIARRDLAAVRSRRLDLISAAWKSYAEMVAILGALP